MIDKKVQKPSTNRKPTHLKKRRSPLNYYAKLPFRHSVLDSESSVYNPALAGLDTAFAGMTYWETFSKGQH
jgi:hypothetical protein